MVDLHWILCYVSHSFTSFVLFFIWVTCMCVFYVVSTDDLVAEKDKSRMLQADMEATLQDIQNM